MVVLSLSFSVAVDWRADFFAESDINEFVALLFGIFLAIEVVRGENWNASVPRIIVDEKLFTRASAATATPTDNIEEAPLRNRFFLPTILLFLVGYLLSF